MACTHTEVSLKVPSSSQSVYREDCTQCFGSIDDTLGLDVCLQCFNGGCAANHALLHFKSSGHPLAVNIKRKRKPVSRAEPPQKISKLAITAETESDRYETSTSVKCYEDQLDNIDASHGKLQEVVDKILKASTFARQAEVKAWEAEITACEHTLCLEQGPSRMIASQGRFYAIFGSP
jgi:ubiquitin carboxyl-terminal hydrolase 5/13